jgi:hypothetical protein
MIKVNGIQRLIFLVLVIPAFGVAYILFSTNISPEELAKRVEENYPGAFDPVPGLPGGLDSEIARRNWEKLSAEERKYYAMEVWFFRRAPATFLIWAALVFFTKRFILTRK